VADVLDRNAGEVDGLSLCGRNMRDAAEIERTLETFAQSANGGLIVTGSASGIQRFCYPLSKL
jgi:hypothetical protein